jgi:3-oxoacyl-[acyl-carrier protein] reductase
LGFRLAPAASTPFDAVFIDFTSTNLNKERCGMLIDFTGKNILVAGAGQGIGKGIARAFAGSGANVHACDILDQEARAIEGACGAGKIAAGHIDVTDEASVAAAVKAASGGGKALYGLIYVAGGVAGQVFKPVEQVSLAEWRKVMDINVTGFFLCARAAIPIMKKQKLGRIVAISSRAGLTHSLTGIQAYCATKHAETGLVKQLGYELTSFNITVNAIAPGFLNSNPASKAQWESYTPEFQKSFKASLVGGRTGNPDDIASAALFLASEQAEWITGQTLPVSGGPL